MMYLLLLSYLARSFSTIPIEKSVQVPILGWISLCFRVATMGCFALSKPDTKMMLKLIADAVGVKVFSSALEILYMMRSFVKLSIDLTQNVPVSQEMQETSAIRIFPINPCFDPRNSQQINN